MFEVTLCFDAMRAVMFDCSWLLSVHGIEARESSLSLLHTSFRELIRICKLKIPQTLVALSSCRSAMVVNGVNAKLGRSGCGVVHFGLACWNASGDHELPFYPDEPPYQLLISAT